MTHKQKQKLKARVENTLKNMPLAPKKQIFGCITDTPEYLSWLTEKREPIVKTGRVSVSKENKSGLPGSGYPF